MNTAYGRLIGVSLGPGDPGLITRRAWAALSSGALWTYPVKAKGADSFALAIVERSEMPMPPDATALVFPMTHDEEKLARCWEEASAAVVETLAAGRDVLFLVEGDASTYSTFGHLARTVREKAPETVVETIAGVTSFAAAAARVGTPLADVDDTLAVLPASYGVETLEKMLDEFDTLVLLKVKPMIGEIVELLRRRGLMETSWFVEKVGTPDEKIVTDLAALPEEKPNYLSLMVVHNPDRVRGELLRGCKKKNGETA